MVVLDEQYVNEEDSTNGITIADTEQSIPILIIEAPNMTTMLSENVPESSLPTTVPIASEPILSNENDDTLSSIASNKTVNDTSVKVYTESEMEKQREMWRLGTKEEIDRLLMTIINIKEKSEQIVSSLKNVITELNQDIVTVKHNFIRNVYHEQKYDLEQLEMFVINKIHLSFVDANNTTPRDFKYYGFRCQLKSMLNAINKNTVTSKHDRVKLWFVSYNAVQDFNNCKSYIVEMAQENRIQLKVKGNVIKLGLNSNNFDIIELIRDFGKSVGMIELDENFLQTVIEISQNHKKTDSGRAKVEQLKKIVTEQSDEMLKDIYNYIMKNLS